MEGYVPDESGDLDGSEEHAVNGSGQLATAQVRVVRKVEDGLESRNQRLEFCRQFPDLLPDGQSGLRDEDGQQGVGPVFAVVPQPAEEKVQVVMGKLIAEVGQSETTKVTLRT